MADGLLALLVIGPAFGGRVNALPGPPIAPTGLSQALVLLSCLMLALRRRYPTLVWAVILAAGGSVILLQHGPSPALLPLLVALYTVASRWPARRSLLAAAGSAGLLLIAQGFATADRWDRPTTYVVATWCLLAAVVGISVRLQRRALAEARERARVAEESREEEAQRRVTEERLRIVRELHDVVAHQIAVINVQSGVAEHLQTSNPARAGEALRHVREASAQVLAEMAALLGVLRDGDGDDGDDPAREPARGLARLDELVAAAAHRAAGRRPAGGQPDDARPAGRRDRLPDRGRGVDERAQARCRFRPPAARLPPARPGHRGRQPGRVRAGCGARFRAWVGRDVRAGGRDRGQPPRGTGGARPVLGARGTTGARRPGRARTGAGAGGLVTIRVLLADDQALIRGGFAALIDSAEDLAVAGEAIDGADAVRQTRALRPDVVLMDVRMPGIDGLTACGQITADPALTAVKVLVLTTFEQDDYILAALQAGASGFLGKGASPTQLLDAIRVVARGEALLSPRATRVVIERALASPAAAPADPTGPDLSVLTEREREIVALVAQGLSNDEIAGRLFLSPLTAKTHVNRAMAKLGARDRAQLVVLAYRAGLVPPR